MNELFGIIFLSIGSIICFIRGYKYAFKTEIEVEKIFSKRKKWQIKFDDFFSVSKESVIFWTKTGGIGSIFMGIILLVLIFLIIFGVLKPPA